MNPLRAILLSVGTVSALTLCSNLLGFAREVLLAQTFGAQAHTDAYLVAIRIVTTAFLLLTASALQSGFLPRYKTLIETGGEAVARGLLRRTFLHLVVLFAAIATAIAVYAELIVGFFAPGLAAETRTQASQLVVVLAPLIPMSVVGVLFKSVLHANHRFAAPASVPLLQNVMIILALLYVAPNAGLTGFAVAVAAGGLWWLILLGPSGLRAMRGHIVPPGHEYKAVLFHMLPLLTLEVIGKVSGLVQTRLLSGMAEGSISAIHFAGKVAGLPTGLFITAIGTVVFPTLVKSLSKDDQAGFKNATRFGFRLLMIVTLPITAMTVIYAPDVVRLLFQGGAFDAAATAKTAPPLILFILSLVPTGIFMYYMKLFYAAENYRIPLLVIGTGQLLQVLFIYLAVGWFGYLGIPIANLLSTSLQAAVMMTTGWFFLRIDPLQMLRTSVRALAATAAICVAAYAEAWSGLAVPVVVVWAVLAIGYLAILALLREPVLGELRRRARE